MIFIDTGAFIAKYLANDQYHTVAIKRWNKILDKNKLFTSNHIIDETITLLMRKTTPIFAVEKAKIFYQTEVFKILRTDMDDELSALKLLEKYKDQEITFTDCLTAVLMKRYNIKKIFTYDGHFNLFNFEITN